MLVIHCEVVDLIAVVMCITDEKVMVNPNGNNLVCCILSLMSKKINIAAIVNVVAKCCATVWMVP